MVRKVKKEHSTMKCLFSANKLFKHHVRRKPFLAPRHKHKCIEFTKCSWNFGRNWVLKVGFLFLKRVVIQKKTYFQNREPV